MYVIMYVTIYFRDGVVGGEHQLFEQGRREQELEDHDRSRHDRWMDG